MSRCLNVSSQISIEWTRRLVYVANVLGKDLTEILNGLKPHEMSITWCLRMTGITDQEVHALWSSIVFSCRYLVGFLKDIMGYD